ncbi:MAG: enoyl-CoA hydratase/isomerase family protein [Bdellovibrionales bacterium]|nr:enoyl-CoA hydratase/isomerase family protein [Bdellovibrionales bacterium]
MESLYSGKAFKLDQEGDLAIVSFDLQGEKINKFFETPFTELDLILEKLKTLASSKTIKAALFRSLKKNSFIVGADLNQVQKLKSVADAESASKQGQAIFSKIEDLAIPTMVAIDGPCMGGGTEFSLSCKYIVCSDSPKTVIGVPEVKLGFLPGWGGTYRLPKRVGLPAALDMILTGKSIRADKAGKMGLVDAVIPATIFVEKSLELARTLAKTGKLPGAKVREMPLQEKLLTSNMLGRKIVFSQARQGVMKATRGNYPSPLRILDLLEHNFGKSREKYLKEEARGFAELWGTPESKSLVGLFFLSEDAKRNSGSSLSSEEVAKLLPIKECAVLGAGVMGGGIASQTAASNIRTLIKDVNMDAVTKALAHARSLYDAELKKKRLKATDVDRRMGLIRGQVDYTSFRATDLVIEAIVENMEVKKKVFAELEGFVRPDCIIASNTSSLKLTEMAKAFKDPSRFVGLHFFNPVHKMPLVEVVTHAGTAPAVTARAVSFVKAIGKTPLVCKDGPGFIVNRLLMPWLNEAAYCLYEGYNFDDMEKALKKFGMPMGPFELIDEIGIDVAAKVAHILGDSLGERAKPVPVMDRIVEAKRLGRKSGLGFYVWDKAGGKRVKPDTEAVMKIIHPNGAPAKPEYTMESIVRRTIFPMINEAAVILEEGLVTGPDQVDLGMIFGTGFPPFRGGLLRYADAIGLDKVVAELDRLATAHGARFQPSKALRDFAKNGGKFYK